MKQPPSEIIEAARQAALRSPCAKSKRGVVLFNPRMIDHPLMARRSSPPHAIATLGFNGPPRGFECKDSMQCRGNCAEICMHAEQRAILSALSHSTQLIDDLELVHIKAVAGPEPGGGGIVAGGPPSCLQCSRLVVDVELRAVWLWESTDAVGMAIDGAPVFNEGAGCSCGARSETFDRLRPGSTGIAIHRTPWCPAMGAHAEWRRYTAVEFHRATLATNDLRSLA